MASDTLIKSAFLLANSKARLTKFRISGFKALNQTMLRFPNRSLMLIGRNGSGKSTILQALGLVREFAYGDASRFFDDRIWSRSDVRSKVTRSSTVKVDLVFDAEDQSKFLWQFDWNLITGFSRREVIWHLTPGSRAPLQILDYGPRWTALDAQGAKLAAGWKLPGSALAYLDLDRSDKRHSYLFELAEWAKTVTSLELLSPTAMRKGTRGQAVDIGGKGEKLASFLAGLDSSAKSAIVERLKTFNPLTNIQTTRKRAGWVDMRVSEIFPSFGKVVPSQVSDGLLRLMAICAIPEFSSKTSLVMLDEIEDGVEPHILPELIERVIGDSECQFIFTSHSPLLVNFFEPTDIHVLDRADDGSIVAAQFTGLHDMKAGLEFFGPVKFGA